MRHYRPLTTGRWRVHSAWGSCDPNSTYKGGHRVICWLTGLSAETDDALDRKIKRAGKWGMYGRAHRKTWERIVPAKGTPLSVPWEQVNGGTWKKGVFSWGK